MSSPSAPFQPGDHVRLTTDSFQGQHGLIKAVHPEQRLALVAVRAYGTTIAVEIDFDSLEPAEPSEFFTPPSALPPGLASGVSGASEEAARPAPRPGIAVGPGTVADRAVFICHQGGHGYSVGVALHRGGRQALDHLRQAAPRLRRGDAAASAARLCGILHGLLDGNRYLTLHPPPRTREDGSVDWKAYGQGDAGVVIIDVANGSVECRAGYLEDQVVEPLPLGEDD